MQNIELPESAKYIFDFTEGADISEKLRNLVRGDLERRLKNCSERIFEYEKKYGMAFGEFETVWKEGKVADMHSHGVERDYMEWESLEDEHRELLNKLKKMKEDQ